VAVLVAAVLVAAVFVEGDFSAIDENVAPNKDKQTSSAGGNFMMKSV
jgi:hypothetical protein